jgi:hypothetical protein
VLYREELEQPDIGVIYKGKALSLANLYLDLAALELLQARLESVVARGRDTESR